MNIPDTHVSEPLVENNQFRKKGQNRKPLPRFTDIRTKLPEPFWENHRESIHCYWKTWELAFSNLGNPVKESRFVGSFVDTAFNGNLFLWDSVFILMFGKYARHIFNFQKTLDNFYSHQHTDGYICREIRESDSREMFERFDPSSTGPNILAWSEWEYFLVAKDKERLAAVFPPLLAYNRWFRKNRSWRDGSYWSSGWGCGMDNQPRLDKNYDHEFDHGHLSWVDTTLQQLLNNRILVKIAEKLGKMDLIHDEIREIEQLGKYVNETMWDRETSFYYDVKRNGELSKLKTIGSYWALLAEVVPPSELPYFIGHLENKSEFDRPHPIPTLSADNKDYCRDGGYWRGGVWSPTNYMVLRGLSKCGEEELAHKIAVKHLRHVIETFSKTDTLWENYSPETVDPGNPSRADFVGWTGLSSVSVLFEYVFGIQPGSDNSLTWNIHLCEKHGVKKYPVHNQLIDLICFSRDSEDEEPQVEIYSEKPVTVNITWRSGKKTVASAMS